jgi:hypothetical protein
MTVPQSFFWITAPDLATMKSHLVLCKLYTYGSSGRLIRLAEISAGRDSGVPQVGATAQISYWDGREKLRIMASTRYPSLRTG